MSPFEHDAKVFDVADTGVAVGTITLQSGTRLAGTVHDDTGAPAANICVAAYGDNWSWVGGGNTGTDGSYQTDVLPAGDWVLSFNDCNPTRTLVNTFWNGTPTGAVDFNGATRVHTDGSTPRLDGYDQTMTRGGTISGVVSTASGPQADVCVNAIRDTNTNNWTWLAGARSASDGSYTLGPIPPGDVSVYANSCTNDSAILEGLYVGPGVPLTRHRESAATLNASADAPINGLDITVEVGTLLSGTVTADGAALGDACVTALDPATGVTGSSSTDSNGTWHTVVPAGSYLVQASSCRSGRSVASRFLDDATDPASARRIAATPGAVFSGLDIDLPTANPGSIRGRVTTSSGVAPQACVVAVAPDSEPVAVAQNASDGTFDLTGINPGSYLVGFAGCDFPQDGLPPGVTDPTDPSVVYPLQWSSGRTIAQDTLWIEPQWVTVTSDTATDIGTVCLQPCPDPTVNTLPGPTTAATTPPPVTGTPGGFTTDPPPTAGTSAPASAASPSTDTLATRAIAPAPPPTAVEATTADAAHHPAKATRTIAGRTESASAIHTGDDDGRGGSTSWWWIFVLAAAVAAVAAGVPWLRSRSAS